MDYQLNLQFTDNSAKQRTILKRLIKLIQDLLKIQICTQKRVVVNSTSVVESTTTSFYVRQTACFIVEIRFSFCRFEAIKPIGKVEIVQSPYVTESTRIAMLLPAFEHQVDETAEFITLYEKTCMQQKDNTFLMLVLVYRTYSSSKSEDDVFGYIKALAVSLSDKYKTDGSRIAWLSIRLPESFDHLPHANNSNIMLSSAFGQYEILSVAVTDLALRKIGLDSLVMICSNTMNFKADVLNRVSLHLPIGQHCIAQKNNNFFLDFTSGSNEYSSRFPSVQPHWIYELSVQVHSFV